MTKIYACVYVFFQLFVYLQSVVHVILISKCSDIIKSLIHLVLFLCFLLWEKIVSTNFICIMRRISYKNWTQNVHQFKLLIKS